MSFDDRVIALAGVFQAARLVAELAREGYCEEAPMTVSIHTVLKINADSTQQIYGSLSSIKLGLTTLADVFDNRYHDPILTRMIVTILHIERKLHRTPDMQRNIQENLTLISQQYEINTNDDLLITKLALLYTQTLSTLKPRVMVQGNGLHLSQELVIAKIRALLLATIRSAVLWRQMGGGYVSLFFGRRRYALTARELLSKS